MPREDHNTFLGNCSPTPPLNQHFALREKQVRKISVGVGLGEGWVDISPETYNDLKKLVLGSHSSELPWASQRFLYFLGKLGEPYRIHEKQKLAQQAGFTRFPGSPLFDGSVTIVTGPTFLHINILARQAGSTRSRRERRCQLLARINGSTFFLQ